LKRLSHNRTQTAFDFKTFLIKQNKEKILKRKEYKDRLSLTLKETKKIKEEELLKRMSSEEMKRLQLKA
jgi:hypothetical protein